MKHALAPAQPSLRRFIPLAILMAFTVQLVGCINMITTAVVEKEKAKHPTFRDAGGALPPVPAGMGRVVLYSPKTSTAALIWDPNAGTAYRLEGDRNGRLIECGMFVYHDLSPGTHQIRRGPLLFGSPLDVTLPAGGTVYVNLSQFSVVSAAEAHRSLQDLRLVEPWHGRGLR